MAALMFGAAELVLPGVGEVRAVVGEHGVNPVGHGRDQAPEEAAGNAARGPLVQLGKGELAGAVDRYEGVEAALFGVHLGDLDVEEADQ